MYVDSEWVDQLSSKLLFGSLFKLLESLSFLIASNKYIRKWVILALM